MSGYRTLGSWMKAPPLLLGGNSPVVAYLRHSIMLWQVGKHEYPVSNAKTALS